MDRPQAPDPERDSTPYLYQAFLSYSHRDERWARWLQHSLETYPGLQRLVEEYRKRGRSLPTWVPKVCRDREDLSAAASLTDTIQRRLRESRFLLVLCSPHSARSVHVDREIRFFKTLGRAGNVLALILHGEPHAATRPESESRECFPPALLRMVDAKGQLTSEVTEPAAADLRPQPIGDGKRDALLKLVSAMLGVGFDELRRRDQARRRRRGLVAAAGALVTMVVVGVFALQAHLQGRRADRERTSAEARALAAEVQSRLEKQQIDLALLLGLETHRRRPDLAGYQPLVRALQHEPRLRGLLHGHRARVRAVHFSSDGDRLASGDHEGEVWIWKLHGSVPSGRRLYRLPSGVKNLAFTAGSSQLLSVDGKDIHLHDASTGQQLRPALQGHPESILAVALSPDGTKAALTGRFFASLWNLKQWRSQGSSFTPDDTILNGVAFVQNGKRLLTAGRRGNVQLWDVETGRLLSRSLLQAGPVLAAAVSPDGAHLATAGDRVQVWDLARLRPQGPSQRGDSNVMGLAFAPDRPWLASANHDGNARLWNLAGSVPIEPPLRHASPVSAGAFASRGRLATGTEEGAIHLWDLDARRGLCAELSVPDKVSSLAFGTGTQLLVGTAGGRLVQHDPHAPGIVGDGAAIPEEPFRLALSPQGDHLAVAGIEGVTLVNPKTRKAAVTVQHSERKGHIPALAFDPSGTRLATGGIDRMIRLWNVQTGSSQGAPLGGHEGSILSLAFDASGSTVASGSGDTTIRLWDLPTHRQLGKPLRGHGHPVFAVAFSSTAGELVSLDRSGEIRFWDTRSGRSTAAFGGESVACVQAASFSADRRWLAQARQCSSDWSLGTGAAVRVWDLRSRVSLDLSSGGLVLGLPAWGALSMSSDGKKVALGGDQTALVWDLRPSLWEARACRLANRNLTAAEWKAHVDRGNRYRYRCSCRDLPPGAGASSTCPSMP